VFDDRIESLKRYFGARKKIRVVTERMLDPTAFPGLTLMARRGDADCDVELDLGSAGIGEFISWANEKLGIRDLSIEEIPIEEVIKTLYATEARE
jgi:ABC-2 type transport system ATP-binding protein